MWQMRDSKRLLVAQARRAAALRGRSRPSSPARPCWRAVKFQRSSSRSITGKSFSNCETCGASLREKRCTARAAQFIEMNFANEEFLSNQLARASSVPQEVRQVMGTGVVGAEVPRIRAGQFLANRLEPEIPGSLVLLDSIAGHQGVAEEADPSHSDRSDTLAPSQYRACSSYPPSTHLEC